MENTHEVNEIITPKKNILFEVTTVSRILAATLFVILPFIGGWIGYIYGQNSTVSEAVTDIKFDTPHQIETLKLNSEDNTLSDDVPHKLIEDVSTEKIMCSALPEIETILSTFDTDTQKFWRRLVFEINDTSCTKRVFGNKNILYDISAGCGFCFMHIYKNESGYQTLPPSSKLIDNLIVTVDERSVEVLDPRTSQSRTVLRLVDRDVNKTFFADENHSSKITYNETDNTISVSVFDLNTCAEGHGGCYYMEITPDLRVVKLR